MDLIDGLFVEILRILALGIVHGLTEFLPVSSSGHLAIIESIYKFFDPNSRFVIGQLVDCLLHMGTLLAVCFAFRNQIGDLLFSCKRLLIKLFTGKFSWEKTRSNQRLVIFLIISCVPLIVPFIFREQLEKISSYLWIVGIGLLITSVVLFVSDRIHTKQKKEEDMTFKDAIIIGLCQMVSMLPGISRSGSTITASVACGYKRSFSAEYSFILSIPVILTAILTNLIDVLNATNEAEILRQLPIGLIGMVTSAVVGYAAIRVLQSLLKKKRFFIFGIYCAVLGACVILADIFLF